MNHLPFSQSYTGSAQSAVRFLTEETYYDRELWAKFVDQFRLRDDSRNEAWRGEYWGKAMRGAAMVYRYSQDDKLYAVLTETVKDLLSTQEENGRISTYEVDREFRWWDMWCRKYVALGLEYFYEICTDESLKERIVKALCAHMDYIMAHVGPEEGKLGIAQTSDRHRGLNSCSILEPVVKLYKITGEQKYLDYAAYIVSQGGCDYTNIFELAYRNELPPYQYGVPKAYEMMSCFEGLAEYYQVTGIEKYKQAVVNFGKALLDTDVTVIGSSGITHELLDFSKYRQTVPYEDVSQETCVTVTLMKFCAKLLELTGDPVFAEQMETSFYNAYLGAMNEQHKVCHNELRAKRVQEQRGIAPVDCFLPFDSYSPLLPGTRGKKVGGDQMFRDGTYYGCCACIAGAGVGAFLQSTVMADEEGVVLQQYQNGTVFGEWKGQKLGLGIYTRYPAEGYVKITLLSDMPEDMKLKCRVPSWSKHWNLGTAKECTFQDGYLVVNGPWEAGDTVELLFDMSIRAVRPLEWDKAVLFVDRDPENRKKMMPSVARFESRQQGYICLNRGPLVLAADDRLGKPADSAFRPVVREDDTVAGTVYEEKIPGIDPMIMVKFYDLHGNEFSLVDYQSAGKDWQSKIAAWLSTED